MGNTMFFAIGEAMGGVGLLLLGIKMMSSGLEVVAGERLQSILKHATSNRFMAATVGLITTIIINSSTAVSVITVGFVNAGLMNLTQAIGVLLGINVGTTLSVQLVAFKIDAYSPIFVLIGTVMYLFIKKRSIQNIGQAVLGFGILFFSIMIMSDALRVFRTHDGFLDMIQSISNPLAALFVGIIITIAIQSSSATISILVTMLISGIPIPFQTSAFIILGANIGTSTTALIASIPASRDGKRTALFHITYDIIGSLVFGTLVILIPSILNWFQSTWSEPGRQAAMFHMLYNIATLTLLISFVTPLAKLMQFVIPLKPDERSGEHEKRLIYLDDKISLTPMLAVANAQLEVSRMGKITNENLKLALDAFFEKDTKKAGKVVKNEKIIDYLNKKISAKLIDINNITLSTSDAKKIGSMFKVISDIERIGDHAENIAEYTMTVEHNSLKFSDAAINELKTLGDLTFKITTDTMETFENQDVSNFPQIKSLEKRIDEISAEYVENHINRLKKGECEPESGVIFTDMIIDLERCSDHANNIAKKIKKVNQK